MKRILLFFCVTFSACSSVPKANTSVRSEEKHFSESPLKPYQPSSEKKWQLIHTDIDITFQFPKRTASAKTILSLHPYFYATDSVVLDAKNMNIKTVELIDSLQNKALKFSYDNKRLTIHLPKTYGAQDTLNLSIKYLAQPYTALVQSGKAITSDRGLYFVNAQKQEPYQPVQIWTQGEPEANSHWFPTFDKPNFRSTFRITMNVPDSLTTLSNGVLSHSVSDGKGQKSETWVQDLPIPPYLVMMAIGSFHMESDSWQQKEIQYLVPKKFAPYAKQIFQHTPEMINFFSNKLQMDFPWAKYSQVAVYDYVSGAMENVSASLFGAFVLKDERQLKDSPNDGIVAHELFHQWFGDYVTAETWSQITLNESFADYGEKLWSEHHYGVSAAEEERIKSFLKYMSQAETKDSPLVRNYYDNPDEVFDRVSYSKGGLILHYLRKIVGDQAFFQALNLYLRQNALQSAEVEQLRISFEQVTGRDLKWFFDQWYHQGGHPKLKISYSYDYDKKSITATVVQEQKGNLYRLPCKVEIIRNGHSEKLDWLILAQRTQSFTYPFLGDSALILIPDVDFWLPAAILDQKTQKQMLLQMKHANRLMPKARILWALAADPISKEATEQIIGLSLKDKEPFIRKAAIQFLFTHKNTKWSNQYTDQLGALATNDPNLTVRSGALNLLGEMNITKFSTTYELAIADPSYIVATAGLAALARMNYNKSKELARKYLHQNKNSALFLSTAGRIIATEGKEEDYLFFKEAILNFYERDRTSFLPAFSDYLLAIDNKVVFNEGIQLWQGIIERDATEFKSYSAPEQLWRIYQASEIKRKISTLPKEKQKWAFKSETSLKAYQEFKQNVKNPAVLKKFKGKENLD